MLRRGFPLLNSKALKCSPEKIWVFKLINVLITSPEFYNPLPLPWSWRNTSRRKYMNLTFSLKVAEWNILKSRSIHDCIRRKRFRMCVFYSLDFRHTINNLKRWDIFLVHYFIDKRKFNHKFVRKKSKHLKYTHFSPLLGTYC